MSKHRGQASGPIELVVAVIILVASLGLAFLVLQNTQEAQCIDKLKSEMRNVQTYVVDVALGSPATTREMQLELGTCGRYSVQAVRLVFYDDPRSCGRCAVSSGGCWLVEPLSFDKQLNTFYTVSEATVCIDVPSRVVISNDDVAYCSPASQDGCPLGSSTTEGCDLSSASGVTTGEGRLLTFGRVEGAGSQYVLRLTKGFDLASGQPQIKACLLTRDAARQLRETT